MESFSSARGQIVLWCVRVESRGCWSSVVTTYELSSGVTVHHHVSWVRRLLVVTARVEFGCYVSPLGVLFSAFHILTVSDFVVFLFWKFCATCPQTVRRCLKIFLGWQWVICDHPHKYFVIMLKITNSVTQNVKIVHLDIIRTVPLKNAFPRLIKQSSCFWDMSKVP
mgnify:CR=1 FL=1